VKSEPVPAQSPPQPDGASLLAVLEDWLLEHERLPDDLCPTASVAAGLELGGEGEALARQVREAFAPQWFGEQDPELLCKALRKSRGKKGLKLQEVERALRFHTESLRQMRAAGLDASDAEPWELCATMCGAKVGGTFELGPTGAEWVGGRRRSRRSLSSLQSRVRARLVPLRGKARKKALPQWVSDGRNLVRPLSPEDRSRKAREEAKNRPEPEAKPKEPRHRWGPEEGDKRVCRQCGRVKWTNGRGLSRYAESLEQWRWIWEHSRRYEGARHAGPCRPPEGT
jgi:hypothetical protein